MEFMQEYWFIIIGVVAVAVCFGIAIYRYVHLPTAEQLDKVREWLLWAVTSAEAEMGSGTGQLKLRAVYDLFVQRFPQLVHVIPFEVFSCLVDDALNEMRGMLNKNPAVKAIVEGGSHE